MTGTNELNFLHTNQWKIEKIPENRKNPRKYRKSQKYARGFEESINLTELVRLTEIAALTRLTGSQLDEVVSIQTLLS